LVVYPPDNQTLLILTGFVSFLAIGSESIFWYVRRTCTEILVDGKWSHGVVTARRTTTRGPVHRITVSVEDNGQCYAREAIVPCKTYFRLRVGQAVQVLHDRQPGGRWVLIRDASAASQAAQ
jgi:hypothetical protein